ncbi:MAG TPA: retropepsin-like aspartic protease [Pirellulaceae bacterium]|nr:retropepsin-like aspartic protease [Pirellulaceae bacterium]
MRYVLCLVIGFAAAWHLKADELAEARAALEKAGVRASSTGIVLVKEGELTKELGKGAGLKRTVLQAEKELQAAELQVEIFQRGVTQLKQQHMQLSAQLANINRNDIALNNKLVSALKVIEGQFDLAKDHKIGLDTQVKNSRAKASEARETYIELALSARRLADEIAADYMAKAADTEIQAALARYNKAAGKQLALAATGSFQGNLRRLKQLEDTVLSESIDLRDEGKTMRVNVVVNGKYQEEMVLDSGASLISLPGALAAKFGLKPSDKDPRIVLQLADGREIDGRLMKLATVRIGKFTVDNVECAVLGSDALAAEPLLGMSFLEHFKFEIDAAGKKLTMVKVSGTDGVAAKK